MDLAWCAKMADEEGDLTCALFDVEMSEIETSNERAELNKFLQEVAAEVHFGEDNGDHWPLDRFEVGQAEVADR